MTKQQSIVVLKINMLCLHRTHVNLYVAPTELQIWHYLSSTNISFLRNFLRTIKNLNF